MKEVFPKPPMVAYKQPRNSSLRSLLVKTKLPEQRSRRKLAGSRKCNRSGCGTCPFMVCTERVLSSAGDFSLKISRSVTCSTSNVVYCISCNKPGCQNIQYIGETGRRLDERFREHVGYVRNDNQSQPTGHHFNLPGHSLSNMQVVILESCKENSPTYRKLREQYFINQFNTLAKGLNKKR